MNAALKQKLLDLISEDERLRRLLGSDGSLYEGYNSRIEQLHLKNAQELERLIGEFGFPGLDLVGAEACAAACRIALHAISFPDFQRKCLTLMEDALERGQVPANYVCILTDRIRFFEGRPQLYGTNMDWDDNGKFVVTPVEDEGALNQRRAFMGLKPMSLRRDFESAPNEKPPADPAARQKEFLAWARRVGWRK